MEHNTLDNKAGKKLICLENHPVNLRNLISGPLAPQILLHDYRRLWLKVRQGVEKPRRPDHRCACIISESTTTNFDQPEKPDLHETCFGKNTHRLENVMTLDMRIHTFFNRLEIWFEAIPDEPNHYKIRVANADIWSLVLPTRRVHFTTDTSFALPHPGLLNLNALACKMLHLPGGFKFFDELDRRLDDYDPYGPVPTGILSMALESMPPNSTSLRFAI